MTVSPRQPYSKIIGALLLAGIAALYGVRAANAGTASEGNEGAAASSGGAVAQEDAENNGTDITRPVNSLELRFQYRPSSSPDSTTEKEYAMLRVTTRIDLDPWWRISLFAQTDGVDKRTTSASSPASGSSTTQTAGLGDSTFQAVLAHKLDERWAFGLGARLVAPTADDDLGSAKWQVMPGFGVRYSFLELGDDTYFVPAMRYAVSVAGTPAARDISALQMAPTFNLDLPDRWFLTLYPSFDIRINYGDPVPGQTGRLFLASGRRNRLSPHR